MSHQGSGTSSIPSSPPNRTGIILALIGTVSICALYLLTAFANVLGYYVGIKPWVGLLFAIFALVMLFMVDRRSWAQPFGESRRAMAFLITLSPIGGELIEVYAESIKNIYRYGPLGIDSAFIIVNVIFIGALIFRFAR